MDKTLVFKVLVLGDSSVGKSSLLRRYVDNQYDDSYLSTIGVDFKIKTLRVNNIMVKLHMWDTAGQERFRSITQQYYRGCDGVFLVVDMTNVETLRNLPRTWLTDVKNFCGGIAQNDPKSPVLIVLANKCDQTKHFQISDGHLSGLLMTHFKTSAKTGTNVTEAFEEMTRQILAKRAKTHTHLHTSNRVSMYRHNGATIALSAEEPQEIESNKCSC